MRTSFELPPTNGIYLISADKPGCGSSTLCDNIHARLVEGGIAAEVLSVSAILIQERGSKSEAEVQKELQEINDPHNFDPIIYRERINQDGVAIVDGKLATTAGPLYSDPERKIVTIDLTAPLVFSTKRVLQREGYDLASIFSQENGPKFIDYYRQLGERAEHDAKLREEFRERRREDKKPVNIAARFAIDTSQFSEDEIIAKIMGQGDFSHTAPDWEISALVKTQKTLYALGVDIKDVNPRDLIHFNHQLESIAYGIERLSITTNPDGIEVVREDLKKAIIDCWFGLMLKKTLRFFEDPETEETFIDDETQKWSPDFYKIAEGWPTLSRLFRNQVILDPFAGSGTLTNLLVARDIPAMSNFSDIAYRGGEGRVGTRNAWYNPILNRDTSRLLFDELPSWYKPSFEKTTPFKAADARKLPYADDSVDYVFADPPYGKNLNSAGIGLLFGSLPELHRVAKKGSVLLVPVSWLTELEAAGVDFEQLTRDVSNGTSNLPVCYILIPKKHTPQGIIPSQDQQSLF